MADFRIRRANDGAERWVAATGRVYFDEAGRPTRGIGTLADITDRKRAVEALRESEERYRALVDTSPDAVYVHRRGIILLANQQAAALLGARDAPDLVGREIFTLVDETSLALARARTATLSVPGARAELAELTYRRLDGTPFAVEAAAASVLIDGELVDSSGVSRCHRPQAGRQRAPGPDRGAGNHDGNRSDRGLAGA